jgi:hypothetical protein
MFNKCLKYDLKSVFSVWWIGAAVLLALAIPAGLAFSPLLSFESDSAFVETIFSLLLMLFVILLSSFSLFTSILVYARYNRHFFSDEGYLTFTLPVKRSTLFLSKVLSGIIIKLTSVLVMALALFLLLLCADVDFIKELFHIILHLEVDFWDVIHFIEIIAALFAYSILVDLVLYFVITFVHSFLKKHRVLTGVGIVYLLYTLATQFLKIFSANHIIVSDQPYYTFFNVTPGFLSLEWLYILAAILTACALFYNLTLSMLQRKLNLQ